MLTISRALRPNEPPWQALSVTTVHRAIPVPPQLGPILPGTGTVIWTPTFPCFVRGFTINDDSTDPLVGAGGATTLTIGCNGGGGNTVFTAVASTLVTYTSALVGWGNLGGSSGGNTNATQDSGVFLTPVGTVPGQVAQFRSIVAFGNAGTITGTLRFRFEIRAYTGGIL